MSDRLDDRGLDLIFREARTHSYWHDRPVPDALLREVYGLARLGPTSANCCPARFVFVRSEEGKRRLEPALSRGNVEKTMSAPVTVIVGSDHAFLDRLPDLFPHADARSWFEGNDALIAETAFRNATLQGAYFILAARALGLDCGPMSGFDPEKVDAEFFAGTAVRSNFLINVGYGVREKLHPRLPRLAFEDACTIV